MSTDRTVQQWLALDDDELIRELSKMQPTPWKHDWISDSIVTYCSRCRGHLDDVTTPEFCSVPDPITIDWNTAMEWRDKAVKKFGARAFRIAMSVVAMRHTATSPRTRHNQLQYGANWFSVYAQPKHYLIAAACAFSGG